jgi:uncharacterized SAM-binding protein YcdF (DUF218 family)
MPIPTLLKQAATPGSIGFLLAGLGFSLVLRYLWPRNRRLAHTWLTIVAGVYLIMSLPWVANALSDGLPQIQSPDSRSLGAIETLVVFDGDNRLGRVRETERVYAAARPKVVQVLGARWLVRALERTGIPPSAIAQDARPSTTREQMIWMVHRFPRDEAGDVAVIASRLQMPRVAALAKAAGVPLILFASPVDDEPPTAGIRLFLPTYTALRVSRDALYEHAALAYYARRGWIKTT